jgi:hypothetical protein
VNKPAKKPVTKPAAKKPAAKPCAKKQAAKFTAEPKDELSLIFIFGC